MSDAGDQEPQPGSPRRALIGLIAIVVLVGVVLLIARELRDAARLQDCVASGRTNCAPIEAPAKR